MAFGHWPYWRQIPMFLLGELPSFPVLRSRNIATQQCVQTLKGHRTYITAATWHFGSIRKHHALTCSEELEEFNFDPMQFSYVWSDSERQVDPTMERLEELQLHVVPRRASEATLSRDCSQLLTASWDRSAKLWPLQTFRKTRTARKIKNIRNKKKNHEQQTKINWKLITICQNH